MTRRTAPIAVAALAAIWALGADAGLYRCIQPDGSISYQQLPCPASADGAELRVDTTPPGGSDAATGNEDYSVQSQLKAMQKARARERAARDKAERAAERRARQTDTRDPARCAKHQAQVARWREEVRNGYRSQNEKEYEAHMLEYHQALVERYCGED